MRETLGRRACRRSAWRDYADAAGGRSVVRTVAEAPLKYVALLRGINVGKGARVPMKTLKALLEGRGLGAVVTYLNSGNVVFDSALSASPLMQLIEDELERSFGENIPTLVKTSAEVIAIAESIPSEWGSNDGEQTYVAYLFSDVDRPRLVANCRSRGSS